MKAPIHILGGCRRHSTAAGLKRSYSLLNAAYLGQIKLGVAFKGENSILFLKNIRQLRIAIAEHARIIQQHITQGGKTVDGDIQAVE